MSSRIFMYHCDPRVNLTPEATMARLNLHALLYPKSVIQDNFLISEHFQKVLRSNNSFPELIRNGVLTLAFREGNAANLVELMRELRVQIKSGEFRGSEDDRSLELYASPSFEVYLRNLDNSIKPEANNFIRWSPNLLGQNYKKVMLDSAQKGLSGIDIDLAVNIYNEVDKLALSKGFDDRHKRSFYYDYALKLENAELSNRIKKWANNQYLRNLPDYYSLKISLPRNTIRENNLSDPFQLIEEMNSSYRQLVEENLSEIIFNEHFLLSLKPDSILEFRSSRQYEEYVDSVEQGKDISKTLANYLNYLADQAPMHYGPWQKEASSIKKARKIKLISLALSSAAIDQIITFVVAPHYPVVAGVSLLGLAVLQILKAIEIDKPKLEYSKNELKSELLDHPTKLDNSLADLSHFGNDDNI